MRESEPSIVPQARLARTLRRYLRFWGPRADADVDDELRFHFDMRVRDHVARGLTREAAEAAVLRRLGNLRSVRAECVSITTRRERQAARAQLVDAFLQDVRFALRTFVRQKGWAAAAILTLALGIGANTAVFSVVNSLILNPLPYPGADRLALVYQEPSTGNTTGISVSITPRPAVVRAWIEHSRTFESLEPFRTNDVTLAQSDRTPATIRAAYTYPSFLSFAGQRPILGRTFTLEEAATGAPVVMLAEGTWRSRFGADPAIIGAAVTLDDRLFTIVGIAPRALRLPRLGEPPSDVWLPLRITENSVGITLIGRIHADQTLASAARELDAIDAQLGDLPPGSGKFRSKLLPPGEMFRFRDSLVLLSGAVAFVLLIACANVAHLLLARAASRQRELAIRTAIGAGKLRLFRQLMTESLVLAAAGCAGGLAVGAVALRVMVGIRPESLAELGAASLDRTALVVTVALAAITGLGFGLIAAIQSARHSTHDSLKAGAPSTSHTRRQNRLRSAIVVSEMALSTTLIVSAMLLVRSVIHLQTSDPGYEPRGLYSVAVGLPSRRYDDAARQAFFRRLLEGARALPGVDQATLATSAPPGKGFLVGALQLEGDPPPPPGTTSFIKYNAVEPSFFRLMGLRFVQGTAFSDSTRRGGQLIVNEGFARKFWRGEPAIGRRVRVIGFDGKGDWMTIVGVVADASTGGLTDLRSDPYLYLPEPHYYAPAVIMRMRPGIDALPGVRALVASLDSHLAAPTLTNIEEAMVRSAARPRFTMTLLASFTLIALVLAAIGLYGVMAYAVAQRTREIGIRMALGATRRAIGRAVVTNGLGLAAVGAAAGIVGAWWATRLVERMLYGVTRTDPVSFALGAVVLLATAALACIVPTSRAAAVDPAITMKAE